MEWLLNVCGKSFKVKVSILLMVLPVSLALMPACNTGKSEVRQSEYYYYPATNMYYDVEKKQYLYSLDGANSWDSLQAASYPDTVNLGEKKVIFAVDSVWKNNASHRQVYGGQLYIILNDDDTTAVPQNAVVTEKVVMKKKKPVEEETQPSEQKKKRGFGRFIENIFGRKKDKKPEQEQKPEP